MKIYLLVYVFLFLSCLDANVDKVKHLSNDNVDKIAVLPPSDSVFICRNNLMPIASSLLIDWESYKNIYNNNIYKYNEFSKDLVIGFVAYNILNKKIDTLLIEKPDIFLEYDSVFFSAAKYPLGGNGYEFAILDDTCNYFMYEQSESIGKMAYVNKNSLIYAIGFSSTQWDVQCNIIYVFYYNVKNKKYKINSFMTEYSEINFNSFIEIDTSGFVMQYYTMPFEKKVKIDLNN